ncbi:hypothetical protein D9757_006204 [Collybiopsis confluens]|uniref:Uncharacterized protein n=1 Tax=Collybiopsis confluens TaxID=2823264 RepID=A0A8H5HKI0_9AGAR|nr:hypothetical protein D9757_006204 [Collybiopsis confluens]
MPTHDAGDEFDQLPDYIDFAAIRDEDWNTMQSLASDTSIPEFVQGSSSARIQDSPVPEYFLDDDDVFDDVFLRHVDVLEEQILNRSRPQTCKFTFILLAPSKSPSAVASTESSTQISAEHKAYPRDSLKRRRQDSPHPVQSNRLDDDWSELLDDWDEELTCPVCFDVL